MFMCESACGETRQRSSLYANCPSTAKWRRSRYGSIWPRVGSPAQSPLEFNDSSAVRICRTPAPQASSRRHRLTVTEARYKRGRPDRIRRRPADGIFPPTPARFLGDSATTSLMIRVHSTTHLLLLDQCAEIVQDFLKPNHPVAARTRSLPHLTAPVAAPIRLRRAVPRTHFRQERAQSVTLASRAGDHQTPGLQFEIHLCAISNSRFSGKCARDANSQAVPPSFGLWSSSLLYLLRRYLMSRPNLSPTAQKVIKL